MCIYIYTSGHHFLLQHIYTHILSILFLWRTLDNTHPIVGLKLNDPQSEIC